MPKNNEIVKSAVVSLEPTKVQQMIHIVRGERVILDRDLAQLYGVETKNLKRQVKRNASRFPSDFMQELTREEYNSLRCQNGTNEIVGAQMEAINESLAELAVKVDSLTAPKREPIPAVGFAATEARYEAERAKKKAEEQMNK